MTTSRSNRPDDLDCCGKECLRCHRELDEAKTHCFYCEQYERRIVDLKWKFSIPIVILAIVLIDTMRGV